MPPDLSETPTISPQQHRQIVQTTVPGLLGAQVAIYPDNHSLSIRASCADLVFLVFLLPRIDV